MFILKYYFQNLYFLCLEIKASLLRKKEDLIDYYWHGGIKFWFLKYKKIDDEFDSSLDLDWRIMLARKKRSRDELQNYLTEIDRRRRIAHEKDL